MRKLSVVLLATFASLPALALACDDHNHGPGKGKSVVGRESTWISGEVREVDLEESTITLGHADIAVLKMGAMESMMFRAADRKVIAVAKPGDKVKFRTRLVADQPTVTRMTIAKQ